MVRRLLATYLTLTFLTLAVVVAPLGRVFADRIVVVNADGVPVADSDTPGGPPRDFSTRPEISAALDGQRTTGTRASETLGTGLLYVAVPVASGGSVHGA